MITDRLPDIRGYDLDAQQLRRLLGDTLAPGRLNSRWAAVRLPEYALYADRPTPRLTPFTHPRNRTSGTAEGTRGVSI